MHGIPGVGWLRWGKRPGVANGAYSIRSVGAGSRGSMLGCLDFLNFSIHSLILPVPRQSIAY
jgi:hypothetical protein